MSTQTTLEPSRFENAQQLLIAGVRERFETVENIPALWQRVMAYHIPNSVGKTAYGLCFNCRGGTGNSEYLAGVEVSDFSDLPSDVSHVSLPPQKYAVFSHRGHVSQLWKTCEQIGKWLEQSGYESSHPVAGTPDFLERYSEEFNPQMGTGGIEVWVPV